MGKYAAGRRVMNNEFDKEPGWITELGRARSDEYTERILAFVQEIEKSCPEPFIPLLTDLALVRALIVHFGDPLWPRPRTCRSARCIRYYPGADEAHARTLEIRERIISPMKRILPSIVLSTTVCVALSGCKA